MNDPKYNLIQELLIAEQRNREDTLEVTGAMNELVYAAIPGLLKPLQAMQKVEQRRHQREIDTLQRKHYDILNDEGPVATGARRFLEQLASVHPLPQDVVYDTSHLKAAPRLYFAMEMPSGFELVKAPDLEASLASVCVLGPSLKPWGNDLGLFAGILPGVFHAKTATGDAIAICDMFPINRSSFANIASHQQSRELLYDNHENYGGEVRVHTLYSTSLGTSSLAFQIDHHSNNPTVRGIGAKVASDKPDVRINVRLTYQGEGYQPSAVPYNPYVNKFNLPAASNLFEKNTSEEVRTPGDPLYMPETWRNTRLLDSRVTVYNVVEDAITFGTTGMIPPKETRAALKKYFENMGILKELPKLRSDEANADIVREYAKQIDFAQDGIAVIRMDKDWNTDSVDYNEITIQREVFGPSAKLIVTFSIGEHSHPDYEAIRIWAPNENGPTFANRVGKIPTLHKFSVWENDKISSDRGVTSLGDWTYTQRSMHFIIKAFQTFTALVHNEAE